MSEYQYYEFRAVDRPLDEKAMDALRSISSRAEITPTSMVNVYNYGDFRGDPDRLMDRYFDAHVYVANWGTRRLMLRLPARAFPLESAKPYRVPSALDTRAAKDHVVIDFQFNEEGDGSWEEGDGWMDSLIPLRSDLLAGDLRCLYLGWLVGVETGEVDEETPEPPVPPGLRQLSEPLQAFADFMRLDLDLVEVAAAASAEGMPAAPENEELVSWVAELPAGEKDGVLVRLLQGEGVSVASELIVRFRKDRLRRQQATDADETPKPPRRTAGELLEAREVLAAEKKRKKAEREARAKAKRDREKAEARARHLDSLTGREEELWRQIESAIQLKQAKEYDHAIELLKDLRDLAQRTDSAGDWATRLHQLRERHRTKTALTRKLNQAGLPK